jgi:hypothetical protein
MRGKPGDSQFLNAQRGMVLAVEAWKAGWHPICPMLNAFWEMVTGELDEFSEDGAAGWLDYDFSLLTRCDAIYRMDGYSTGADREVAVMQAAGKPVIYGPDIIRGPSGWPGWDFPTPFEVLESGVDWPFSYGDEDVL